MSLFRRVHYLRFHCICTDNSCKENINGQGASLTSVFIEILLLENIKIIGCLFSLVQVEMSNNLNIPSPLYDSPASCVHRCFVTVPALVDCLLWIHSISNNSSYSFNVTSFTGNKQFLLTAARHLFQPKQGAGCGISYSANHVIMMIQVWAGLIKFSRR